MKKITIKINIKRVLVLVRVHCTVCFSFERDGFESNFQTQTSKCIIKLRLKLLEIGAQRIFFLILLCISSNKFQALKLICSGNVFPSFVFTYDSIR